MPADEKAEVKESLLREQGYLCAYCMCRIDNGTGKHRSTIEHCTPQAVTTEKERLNYKNMIAVCWGNRDAHCNDDKSCDAKRGSLPLERQGMEALDVFRGESLTAIHYSSDGTMYSEDAGVDRDINLRLNLNCEARMLKQCRRSALIAVQKKVNADYPNKTAPKEYYRRLLDAYMQQGGYCTPYCGIIIDWLKKRV
ncbi:MAG: hypothetical protein ACI3V2_04250 [Faecousia sp.]